MTPITLITADLHLSENPRDEYRFKFLDKLPKLLARYSVERLLILGDLTEEKDRHSGWLANRIADQLQTIARQCRIVILRGNHDYLDADYPFFAWLRHIEQIEWINESLADATVKPKELFLPHTRNYEKDWPSPEWMEPARIIFAHNTFTGAIGGSGRRLEGIPLDVFKPGQIVISGDVHVPQKLGPVTYVGAPYTIDFGDDYQPRVLILQGSKLTSVRLKGPQKRLIETTWPIGDLWGDELNLGDLVKLRIVLELAQLADWSNIVKQAEKWADDKGVSLRSVVAIRPDGARPVRSATTAPAQSDTELLEAYARRYGIADDIKRTGLKLLEQSE